MSAYSPMPNVLYEDNHLLVVEKPVNMPVCEDISGDTDLLTLLKAYIKEKYDKPGDVYLGLVHRLDRPVGGVMVFARTSKAAARLTSQFQSHEAKKRYVAVVDGAPAPEAKLTDYLLKDEATHSSSAVPMGTPGAKEARLAYSLLGINGKKALLDVELFTGRPHQIRVQLAHAELPISGDQRYHPSPKPGEQIALYAYALTLRHPTLNEPMTFTCMPRLDAFLAFPAQLALLPAFSVCRGVSLDGDVLAVDKNPGVEVEGQLLGELTSLIDEVYPVHRLDANTAGVTLFARTEASRDRLLAAFRDHTLEKVYRCIVMGAAPDRGTLVHYIEKEAEHALVRLVDKDAPGALRCELTYTRLATDGEKSLLEIHLETGRTHQIRVQMAAIGHPVLGDDKYGDRAFNKANHCRTQQLLCKCIVYDGKTYESLRELTL